jgi:DNA-directed RNA polymerase subunit M/transcription elongation factor TFIIS
MLTEQQCESEIRCPECDRPMYALKGALNPIFVCSNCGASIDEKTLFEKRGKSANQPEEQKKSLMENLFPQQFMRKYTCFETFSDFIYHCDLFNESLEEISKEKMAELPEKKINRYVKKHTSFSTWNQMFEKALEWYLKM